MIALSKYASRGMLQRLDDRHHQRQRDADGDRHVHVERILAQRLDVALSKNGRPA